ncbi:MAG: FG-GAP repeat protein [Alphaproteobacteria bacterium]|nr:FG-GAP repeat protein [Alphaproteobacteria bacterium]MCB9698888.1 FG-GAP repeat protein [Alphaproteobacteria bacterium]
MWSMGEFGWTSAFGAALALHAEGLVIGAPGGDLDELGIPQVWLPSRPYTGGHPQEDWFALENPTTWDRWTDSQYLGTEVLAPGDVTGDGVDDLLAFDTVRPPRTTGYLVPGPLGSRRVHGDDPGVLPLLGPHRGTRCGDVTGDGRADLCLDTGVVPGPVVDPVTPTVTWSGFDPSDARMVAGDLDGDGRNELFLWDRGGAAVRVLTAFPPGDHALGTLATRSISAPPDGSVSALEIGGDLDGDGRDDLLVAWLSDELGGRVWIVTDPAATSLEDAWATWEGAANAVAVGDLNGDGVDDLVLGGEVALPGLDRSGTQTVSVLFGPLHAGRLTEADVTVTWLGATLDGDLPDGFGHALELFDVDGDGQHDLVVSAPREDDGTWTPFGRVYLTTGPWTP